MASSMRGKSLFEERMDGWGFFVSQGQSQKRMYLSVEF